MKLLEIFENSYISPRILTEIFYFTGQIGELVYTYDSRALSTQIQEGTYYIKFKLRSNLPSDLSFEYGEAIPWFNKMGSADQIKSSYNFGDLVEGVHYDVLEKLIYQNGEWIAIP